MTSDVDTAARMYECQRAARSLLGAQYDTTIASWRDLITLHMQAHGRSVLHTVIDLSPKVRDADGVGLMLLTAAAVDMIEGTDRDGRE